MFGYPAAFADGHLVTGLFQDRWMVRLPDDALAELAAAGGAPFEPMPGKPMRGYLTFPPEMVADPAALRPWLDRAWHTSRPCPPRPRSADQAGRFARGMPATTWSHEWSIMPRTSSSVIEPSTVTVFQCRLLRW